VEIVLKGILDKLGGYSKGIFEFRIELYAINVSFNNFIFGAG
jgi:hypothetical protein